MSHGLIQQDWNDRINQCLERIVTGSWVEYQYIANPSDARLDYHKRVVRECYLRHAEAGSFDIECVMEDIIDHDETQLEMASDLLVSHQHGDMLDAYNQSYEDLLWQLKMDLAEESGFIFLSDYGTTLSNDALPLFVLNTLAEMHAYFEVCYPSKYGVQGNGIVPRCYGQFDAQTVLFKNLVEYEPLQCVRQGKTLSSPLLCRLDRSRLVNQKSLKGVVSYVNQ